MKENYLVKAFRETAATRFPAQAAALQDALQLRLQALRLEYAGADKELWVSSGKPDPARHCGI